LFLICIATDFVFLQDKIDTFFQGPPNVVKDAKLKSRKRSIKGTGSKSVKQNKSSKKIVVNTVNHPVPSIDVQRTSTIFNPDKVSGIEDATIVDAEKLETVNSFFFQIIDYKFVKVNQLIFMQLKTILSWGHVVDKIKISNNSDQDVVSIEIF
jgi:hypothetical protein